MSVNGKQNGTNGNGEILDPLVVLESLKSQSGNGESVSNFHQIQAEDLDLADPSDGSNKEYRKVPYEYADPHWQIGWTDGRYGQSEKANEAVLRAEGHLNWIDRLEARESKIAQAKGRVESLRTEGDQVQPKLTAVTTFFQSLNERRQESFADFSRRLGILYAVFAVILLAADIPLSLRLVAAGIGVKTSYTEAGHKFSPDDIFLNAGVFVHLWDAIVLAIGIAALGIFIKYYLDTIVFREHRKTSPSWIVRIFMTITLIALIASICILGVYRAQEQQRTGRQDIAERIREKYRANAISGVGKATPEEIETEIQTAVASAAKEENNWQAATFIALTLLLPVTAGFCFSTSGRRLRNAKQFERTKSELEQLEQEYRRITKELNEAEQNLAAQEKRLDREMNDPKLREALVELPRLLYLHGYQRGSNVPETLEEGVSLYERCRKNIEKLLAKKIRGRLWR